MTRNTVALTLGLVVSLLGTKGAWAGDGIGIPGTTLVFKPFIETESGYDSNPDNFQDDQGSSFLKAEGGVKFVSKTATEFYSFLVKGREVYFNELDNPDRWDLKVAFDSQIDVDSKQTVKFGSLYFRDFFNIERADIFHSYGDYTLTETNYRLKLEAKSHVEINIDDDLQGTLDPDVFNVSKSSAFDYSRTAGRVSTLLMTQSWLQPFFIAEGANLDYFNQTSDPSIDRNANEAFAIAGLRIKFGEDFRIDAGVRGNYRNFSDTDISKFDSIYPDLNAFWRPTDTVKMTAILERYINEPSTAFGLADDVRTAGLTLEWRPRQYWRMNLAGYYDRVEPIGDDFLYNRYLSTATLTYEPGNNVEYFLSTLAKYVEEEVTGESYDRYKIGLGLRYSF